MTISRFNLPILLAMACLLELPCAAQNNNSASSTIVGGLEVFGPNGQLLVQCDRVPNYGPTFSNDGRASMPDGTPDLSDCKLQGQHTWKEAFVVILENEEYEGVSHYNENQTTMRFLNKAIDDDAKLQKTADDLVDLEHSHARYGADGQYKLPDAKYTPGQANPALTKAVLCAPGFRTGKYRSVSESEKHQDCREYGVTGACPDHRFEIDHLISLELGGSDAITNLWPQPWQEARVKDKVENKAHAAVCAGKITLQFAQHAIATDWVKFGEEEGWLI